MPTLNEMLNDMPTHKNFYIRGIVNSILPEFMNPLDDMISEENVSGEALEAMRLAVTKTHPDLQDGQIRTIDYAQLASALGGDQIEEEIAKSLGQFGVTKKMQGAAFPIAEYLGGVLMPEKPDGSSMDDALRIRIRIPNEPQVVDMDFDNDIEPTASTFVFEGPMTNKRKKLWDTFTSMFVTPAEADQLDRLVPLGLTGKQTRDFYENYAKELTRDGAVPAMGSAQVPLSPDTDTSFLDN